MPHKMMLITTGGTIAGQVGTAREGSSAFEKAAGSDTVTRDAKGFAEMIGRTAGYLRSHQDIDLDPHPHALVDPTSNEPVNVDSSDINPGHWVQLINVIEDNYETFDSFVILHGTNTLGYTCAALSFAIANSKKPIILTGSQVPAGIPGTDALTNLENAIRVAVWRHRRQSIQGVMAVFGSHIITGTRVKKNTEFDYDAFTSFGTGSIGRIGRIININEENLKKHNDKLETTQYNLAETRRGLVIAKNFETNIVSLTEFPGMDYRIFSTLVERMGVKGFILRAFGAGDPATDLHPAFEYLRVREIPIVVTTQAPNGNANFQVNEPGMWLKENEMAIPAYDMSIEAQTAKLSWLLAQRNQGEITYAQLCEKMTVDLRGEINVIWEIGI